uniref:Uncharacterized protein n=1 Tax=Arundo donax TaxID=35708 RepID=A0A0A9D4G1_ARUDO
MREGLSGRRRPSHCRSPNRQGRGSLGRQRRGGARGRAGAGRSPRPAALSSCRKRQEDTAKQDRTEAAVSRRLMALRQEAERPGHPAE